MPSDAAALLPSTPWTSAPKSRAAAIETILERWKDITETQIRGFGGDGEAISKNPHERGCLIHKTAPPRCTCSYRTVVEIERLIKQLRDDYTIFRDTNGLKVKNDQGKALNGHGVWRHLNMWWITAEQTLFAPPNVTKSNKHKRKLERPQVDQHGEPLRQVRVFRNAEARHQLALKAVEWIAENWGLTVEPMLPRELVQAA